MLLLAAAAAVATATAAAAAPPAQLPPITIAPGVAMPAVSCGHPDDTASVNCTHGKGPGCAAVAGKMNTAIDAIAGCRHVERVDVPVVAPIRRRRRQAFFPCLLANALPAPLLCLDVDVLIHQRRTRSCLLAE